MVATAEQIRHASRPRLLAKMSKAALMEERRKVLAAKGIRIVGEGKPSKEEIIHEILEAEGLL